MYYSCIMKKSVGKDKRGKMAPESKHGKNGGQENPEIDISYEQLLREMEEVRKKGKKSAIDEKGVDQEDDSDEVDLDLMDGKQDLNSEEGELEINEEEQGEEDMLDEMGEDE